MSCRVGGGLVGGAGGQQLQQQLHRQGGLAHAGPAGDHQPAAGQRAEVPGQRGDGQHGGRDP
ncbi:hypothetical protein [Streptosporangium sandarakinum]|uniref:hypothetical protein n=1 Tax=Streptosporangium sandarakinum TaxID=1260955 RepID=UPI003710F748